MRIKEWEVEVLARRIAGETGRELSNGVKVSEAESDRAVGRVLSVARSIDAGIPAGVVPATEAGATAVRSALRVAMDRAILRRRWLTLSALGVVLIGSIALATAPAFWKLLPPWDSPWTVAALLAAGMLIVLGLHTRESAVHRFARRVEQMDSDIRNSSTKRVLEEYDLLKKMRQGWQRKALESRAALKLAVKRLGELTQRLARAETFQITEVSRLIGTVRANAIARKLQSNPDDVADLLTGEHPDVFVLFADVSGFTEWSQPSQRTPNEVAEQLCDVFERIDSKVALFGFGRLKTMGDCYFGITKLFSNEPLDPNNCMNAAKVFVDGLVSLDGLPWKVVITRGRVASGSIAAGFGGFDVWGEPVNRAARLMATAKPNSIRSDVGFFASLDPDVRSGFGVMVGDLQANGFDRRIPFEDISRLESTTPTAPPKTRQKANVVA